MSPRLTNFLLGVALLACGIYAYQWHSQLKSLQGMVDSLQSERDRLNRRVAELKETKSNPVVQIAETPETEATDSMGPGRRGFTPGDNGGPPPGGFRGGDGGGRFMAMMDNPEIQKLMTLQQKAALDTRFASLFKSLNLSPADLEKFKSLLVDKQTAVMDARAAARAQGLTGPENRDALRQVIANAQAEVDNSIRSTLGDAAFAQYQNYEQTLPERIIANQLQQRLSYSSAPLTDTQTNQIVALLATYNQKSSPAAGVSAIPKNYNYTLTPTSTGNIQGQYRGSAPITDAVIIGSQSILGAVQLEALTQLKNEQQAQADIAAQLRAARKAATANANSGTNGAMPVPNPKQ